MGKCRLMVQWRGRVVGDGGDAVVGLRRWFGSVIGWRIFRTSLTAVTLTFTASLKCGEVVCSIQVRGTRE